MPKTANLIDKCLCSDCFVDQLFSHISPSPWASLFPETHDAKVRPIYKATVASQCSSEERNCTLNQKLEMIKVHEEGMLKAHIGQN